MRQSYPSDISRAQFDHIRPMLESAKKVTHPRKIDLYDIFCALLYVLKEGCRWRWFPHDFPKWQNVYKHFKIWSAPDENERSLLDRVQKNLLDLGLKWKSLNATSFINSLLSQNAGLWKELSDGLKTAGDFGKTAKGSFILPYK